MVVARIADYTEKSRRLKIKSDLLSMIRAAQMYRAVEGSFPQNLEEAGDAENPLWTRECDPWGNSYTYRVLGDRIRVSCLGPDGREGGGDDIVLEAGPDDDPLDLPEEE